MLYIIYTYVDRLIVCFDEFINCIFLFPMQDQVSFRSPPTERTPILARQSSRERPVAHGRPISLKDALHIPGVVEFSLCLFFTKLVSYTFMYWLPLYIQSSSKFLIRHKYIYIYKYSYMFVYF